MSNQKLGYIFLTVTMLGATAVLALLKLASFISITWLWVFSPIWGTIGFFLAVFIFVYITIVISDLSKEVRKK